MDLPTCRSAGLHILEIFEILQPNAFKPGGNVDIKDSQDIRKGLYFEYFLNSKMPPPQICKSADLHILEIFENMSLKWICRLADLQIYTF